MNRLVIVPALLGFVGATLLLSEVRWFRRPRLVDRLLPYAPARVGASRAGVLSVASFRDVVGPLATVTGERLAAVFGVSEACGSRLRRIHSTLDVTTFRVRQLRQAVLTMLGGALTSVALGLPVPVSVFAVIGAPLLAFLLAEQRLQSASTAWQRRIFLELPVVAEQLGMLLSAGYSLGAALDRVTARSDGACASDLQRVRQRIRQGLTESEALREWAALADVDALHRLVPVLALNREAGDLGRLVSTEARSIRRDAQRELIETIERRNQQVWIPVTVAALVPGVLLMGVPFIDALTVFSAT